MEIHELSIRGVFEITPRQFADDRGAFLESYRFDAIEKAVGHALTLRQSNTSVSKRGVLRGIHFADVPLGQAKYVTCHSGRVLDFAIDIRVGSPTFGKWEAVELNDRERKSVYIAEGIGHAFVSLEDDSVVSYLVSDIYRPSHEHGINPLDPEIGLRFSIPEQELILSPKDLEAPALGEAERQGMLPSMEHCLRFYKGLAGS